MDSRLESMFRHIPRHAESADTRLGIRRDEKQEQGGRKNGERSPEDEAAEAQDRMSVSVGTVILFLENLAGASHSSSLEPAVTVSTSGATGAPLTPSARAAQAYQSTDRGGRPVTYNAPQPAPGQSITLTPDEIREAHRLIDALKALAARRVEMLDIEWQGGFLQSVARAIAAAGG